MGWGDWLQDIFGDGESREKIEEKPDGGSKVHYMRNDNSNDPSGRKNHSHVVIERREDGSTKSAHATGRKDQRS